MSCVDIHPSGMGWMESLKLHLLIYPFYLYHSNEFVIALKSLKQTSKVSKKDYIFQETVVMYKVLIFLDLDYATEMEMMWLKSMKKLKVLLYKTTLTLNLKQTSFSSEPQFGFVLHRFGRCFVLHGKNKCVSIQMYIPDFTSTSCSGVSF